MLISGENWALSGKNDQFSTEIGHFWTRISNGVKNLKKVMTECASEIESFGIELPDEFSCERFPRKDSDHPCIPIQMHTEELPPGTLRWNIEETGGDLIQREMQCPVEQR